MLKFSYRRVLKESNMAEMVEVANFKALSRDKLPLAYLNTYPNCYTLDIDGKEHLIINSTAKSQTILSKGQLITPESLEALGDFLERCGDNLHRIKRYLAKAKARWETKKPRTLKF